MAAKPKKSGRPRSKAAQATAEARKDRDSAAQSPSEGPGPGLPDDVDVEGVPEAINWTPKSGRGGLISGMRTGIQDVADPNAKKKSGVLNTILWILLAVAAVAFVLGDVNF
jgi:hypothetical protein